MVAGERVAHGPGEEAEEALEEAEEALREIDPEQDRWEDTDPPPPDSLD